MLNKHVLNAERVFPTWARTCLAAVKVTYCSLSLSRKTTRQVQVDQKNGLVWKLWVLSKCRAGMKPRYQYLWASKHETTHPPLNSRTSRKEGWFRVKQTCAKNVDEYRNNARHHLELQGDEVKTKKQRNARGVSQESCKEVNRLVRESIQSHTITTPYRGNKEHVETYQILKFETVWIKWTHTIMLHQQL